MRAIKTFTFILLTVSVFAQNGMNITLETSDDNSSCVAINLTSSNPQDVLLRGQNYRLFYNDKNLDFSNVHVYSELALNNFDAEIALHRDALSKKVDGNIPFEDNMGFISLNVMPDDEVADYVYMESLYTLKIADVCFGQKVNLDDIILAERGITTNYAPAYSVIDWEAAESTDKKLLYTIDLDVLEAENNEK